MKIPEFIEETEKIEKFFSKELDEYQRQIWYRELKVINVNRYKQIIMQVFRKCKFMPKLADILEINDILPYIQNTDKQNKTTKCQQCKGLGIILEKRILNNGVQEIEYTYALRCNCLNGIRFVYDGSKIDDNKHRSKFYIKEKI